jgi:D-aminoacyl-tRNA deacylase
MSMGDSMRILLQNVLKADVRIHDQIVGHIGHGFLLLVGFTHGDHEELCRTMAEKVLGLRLFADERGLTNKSINDIHGEILSVSQFTLYGDVRKGRRPSFTEALAPLEAAHLYDYFNQCLEALIGPIQKGVFGGDMEVSLVNEGPFTMMLDSKELYGKEN